MRRAGEGKRDGDGDGRDGGHSGFMPTLTTLQIQTNAFHRSDPDTGRVGIFLDPFLAMANHSCMPNAFVHFIGAQAVLRAETPIEAGDEIEIAYTGSLCSRPCMEHVLGSLFGPHG